MEQQQQEIQKEVDVEVSNGGNVFTFCPLSERAQKWVEENVPLESWQRMGPAFVCEARFASDLAAGMIESGLHLA